MKILLRDSPNTPWQKLEPFEFGGPDGEKKLEELLEKSPDLLSSEGGKPVLFFKSQVPLGDNAVDLLGVDADGTIVLVECKLDANREARRMVVGQILEYAGQQRFATLLVRRFFLPRNRPGENAHHARSFLKHVHLCMHYWQPCLPSPQPWPWGRRPIHCCCARTGAQVPILHSSRRRPVPRSEESPRFRIVAHPTSRSACDLSSTRRQGEEARV